MENDLAPKLDRVLIVDHMCVLPYGHNLNALILFEQTLRPYFKETRCLATRLLPDNAEQASLVDRVLSYPYDGLISAPGKRTRTKSAESSNARSSLRLVLQTLFKRALYTSLNVLFRYDHVRARTERDWKRVFRKYEIGPRDVIFFPSAEYFGCLSLLDLVRKLPESRRPQIHFRMIGVMESATYNLQSGRPQFFSEIRRATSAEIALTVSAETPPYCDFIARLTGAVVTYMPYPLATAKEELLWRDVKVVASPGQGRADKGFLRLHSIISALQRKGKLHQFTFDVQNMRRNDPHFRSRYESILKHTPRLLLRNARLSQAEIDDVYKKSDILVLPYETETYALRGSAVFQEGLAIGRPVVCSTGMGFSDLVMKYGNGLMATTDRDFADSIVELAGYPKAELEERLSRARAAYEADFDMALNAILKGFENYDNA